MVFKKILSLVLVLMLIATSAFAVILDDEGYLEEVLIAEGEEIPLESIVPDETLNASLDKLNSLQHILLCGIDARPGQKTGRSDTMIILTVDMDNGTIKLLSLMRDIYVEIPGQKNNRLNAAYYFGGPELLMETIEKNFGIHIDNYVAVNFSMLADIIDQLGGITLTVESDYYVDRINAVIREDNKVLGIDENDGLLTHAGEQKMTGKQAQAYARYRYGTKDGDFGRTARQREVVFEIFQSLTERTVLELAGLAMANIDNVYTNLSLQDVMLLAPALLSLKDAELQELRIPINNGYESKTVSGMSVLVPNRKKTMTAIAEFLIN